MSVKRIIGYIGSKVNLYDFIEEKILNQFDKKMPTYTFVDLFAGTCSVSKLVRNKTDWNIISNDLSKYSEILFSELKIHELSDKQFDLFVSTLSNLEKLKGIKGNFFHEFSMGGKPKTISDLSVFNVNKKIKDDNGNIIKETSENYQTYPHSRMFFKGEVGMKIDVVKKELKNLFEKNIIDEEIKNLCLLFLLSYANRNSNTTSVYGAYLKHDKIKNVKPFIDEELYEYILDMRNKHKHTLRKCNSFSLLADKAVEKINNGPELKLIYYIDPPYSSRSYESNYHILDYLCDLDFNPKKEIKENSKTGTRKGTFDNPFTSKTKTFDYFKELLLSCTENSKDIFISYNNEGLLKKNDIITIVNYINNKTKSNFVLNEYKENYKRFTSGENSGSNTGKKNTVEEIIWHIKG